ncbi:MraY family glycosyltransferase [Pseudomonas sp. XK-1]|uniref:MraY family glycosyltransferase n=1 Tax=Pseudomonas sp. XK-1 TaxID=3136019 RepID=UPI0031195C79
MTLALFLLVGAFSLSFLLTMTYRRFALRFALFDVPNARSSHSVSTPRGGGVAIALTVLVVGPLWFWSSGDAIPAEWQAVLVAGAWFAFIGWLDDLGVFFSTLPRLGAQFFGAFLALSMLSGVPPIMFGGIPLGTGWLGVVVGLLYMVWMINLYNFMDGINGLASLEAVTVCVGLLIISSVSHWEQGLSFMLAVLASASAGFALWNFPKSRIFMGDSGSYFLGGTLATLLLAGSWVNLDWLWCGLIMLGVFITDATLTLARRLARGERLYQAHREHAYQHAARAFGKHAPVTLAVCVINVVWLLPMALLLAIGVLSAHMAIIIAYAPLLLLALYLQAGLPERNKPDGLVDGPS